MKTKTNCAVSAKITKGRNVLSLEASRDNLVKIEINGSESILLSEPAINNIQDFLFKRWCYKNDFTFLNTGRYSKNDNIFSKEVVVEKFTKSLFNNYPRPDKDGGL